MRGEVERPYLALQCCHQILLSVLGPDGPFEHVAEGLWVPGEREALRVIVHLVPAVLGDHIARVSVHDDEGRDSIHLKLLGQRGLVGGETKGLEELLWNALYYVIVMV